MALLRMLTGVVVWCSIARCAAGETVVLSDVVDGNLWVFDPAAEAYVAIIHAGCGAHQMAVSPAPASSCARISARWRPISVSDGSGPASFSAWRTR